MGVSSACKLVVCVITVAVLSLTLLLRASYVPTEADCIIKERASTLVVYLASDTDPEYEYNLRFFFQYGMHHDGIVEYVFIVQEHQVQKFPSMPSNARLVVFETDCSAWGVLGWLLLLSGQVDISHFDNFVVTSSFVRGPYLPPYLQGLVPWYTLLTQRLSDKVKLVGCTISCEVETKGGVSARRTNPHVQSYCFAMDKHTFRIFQQAQDVLQCSDTSEEELPWSDHSASLAILNAGLDLDSIITRYQGVDWHNRVNWGCNAGIDPTKSPSDIHPFDALFVHISEERLQNSSTSVIQALQYEKYMLAMDDKQREVCTNKGVTDLASKRDALVAVMRSRGRTCWDADVYLDHNPDVKAMNWSHDEVWDHALTYGQFDEREQGYICDPYLHNLDDGQNQHDKKADLASS